MPNYIIQARVVVKLQLLTVIKSIHPNPSFLSFKKPLLSFKLKKQLKINIYFLSKKLIKII